MVHKVKRGDDTMKQVAAILTVIALIVSCVAVCVVTASPLNGDVDQNGAVNMKDLLTLRKVVAELLPLSDELCTDVNGDTLTNLKDVLALRRLLAQSEATATATTPPLPTEDTELRGVWFAYYEVASLYQSTPEATKAAIDEAFDICREYGINTVFFHVHAYSDAYYNSAVFPQTAATKTLLSKGFDPLAYAIEAAHSRGMALHAWLNPYRVGKAENAVCDDTFVFNSKVYYSPASETVRQTLLSGIEELLVNYDVDGIHFDDYFYPSGVPATVQDFDIGYERSKGDLGDWRRAQVTDLVKRACALTHSINPAARFGISPAGNVKSDRETLYADVETWLSTAGCVDYLCPQIYYGFQSGSAPFSETVRNWASLPRANGVKLYIGLATYKAGLLEDTWARDGKNEWANGGDILARQVKDVRAAADVSGFALFSFRHLTGNGFADPFDETVMKQELKNLKQAILA